MFKHLLLGLAGPFLLFGQQSPNLSFRRPISSPPPTLPDPSLPWNEIREAHLIDASTGWVLQGHKLLLTDAEGKTSKDITPPVGEKDMINAVHFFGKSSGWVVIQGWPTQPKVRSSVTVAATDNGGKSWILSPVGAEDDFFLSSYVGNATLEFLNSEVGFGLFQMTSSSASSAASLFKTSDGGKTWTFVTNKVGNGEIQFLTPSIGWLLGGMRSGDRSNLHRTTDGGVNWNEREYPFPPGVKDKWDMELIMPSFSNLRDGVLEGTYSSGNKEMTAHYSTSDEGNTWKLEGSKSLQVGKTSWMKSTTLDHSSSLSSPEVSLGGAYLTIRSSTSEHQTTLSFAYDQHTPLTIQSADFSDPSHGWIVVNGDYNPLSGRHGRSALIVTSDGGAHLETILTDVDLSAKVNSAGGTAGGVTTDSSVSVSPWTWWGLDACGLDKNPMAVNSLYGVNYDLNIPYYSFGFYLQGSESGPCDHPNITYINGLACSDWVFMPLWDGYQASCKIGFSSHPLDPDLTTDAWLGYIDGDRAAEALNALGFSQYGAGAYLDLEEYPDSTQAGGSVACSQQVSTYLNAYVKELKGYLFFAGVYGAAHDVGTDMIPGANGIVSNWPDEIWMANSGAPLLFGDPALDPLSDGYWVDAQRSRQILENRLFIVGSHPKAEKYDMDVVGSQVVAKTDIPINCQETYCEAQCWQGRQPWCGAEGTNCLACTYCAYGSPVCSGGSAQCPAPPCSTCDGVCMQPCPNGGTPVCWIVDGQPQAQCPTSL